MAAADFFISDHAAQRYIERVAPNLSPAQAREAIRGFSRGISAALSFGCKAVRLPCGAHLILDPPSAMVITVYPPQPKVHSPKFHGRRHLSRGAFLKNGAKKNGRLD